MNCRSLPLRLTLLILLVTTGPGTARLFAQAEPMHPILTIPGSGSGANTVTNISESSYTNNFIPHSPPRNNSYGFVPAVVTNDTGWSWSASNPNQITSTPSGTIFPNTNTAWPVRTQAVAVFLTTATNNLTTNVNAVYYNKAGSTSSKSFVFNLIDYNKLNQLRSDVDKLAPAYVNSGSTPATRTDNYARRIAISLLDWARWHPSYYLTDINSATYINVTPNYLATTSGFGPQRASDHNGLAHEWADDELLAFDAIYSSVALTNLNAEMGYDVRQYICNNLFFDEGDFLVNHIPISIAIESNLSGPYAVLPQVARVLNRPDYIVWMDTYLDATVRQKIRRDGALEEGLGYSIGYLNANQDAAQNTHDYFLTRGATNSLLLSISNRATIFNTTFQYGQAQWALVALPNGEFPSFGDTPFDTYFPTRSTGNSAIMPAYGHVSMGAGTTSSTAVQVNQSFPGNNNHMRSDTTAFSLWAFGSEYLGNIRYYNGSIGRNFGEQILEKNAVSINRVDLSPFPDADTSGDGNLTLYEPGDNGLAMTEIDGYRDYSDYASRYQRLMFLNSVDLAKPYLVDVFRVTGGTNHDYTFHGAILWNENWQCSFPLVTNPAPYPMLEGSETWSLATDTPYYGFWRNVSSNLAPGNFQITYADTNRSLGRDTKLWMTADPNVYNVYIGTTPVPARDNTVPTNFFNSLGLTRPSTIIRHRITSGSLGDLFVSVIEPLKTGVDNIASVVRLPMSGSSLESCALKITFTDGRVDTYVVNLQNPKIAGASAGSATVSTADGQYSLAGRVGVVMDRTSGDPRVWTVNATDFQYPGRRFTTPNLHYSGLITGSQRKQDGGSNDAFTTTSPLPTGTVLQNKFLSLTHGALSSGTTNISEMYRIDQVQFTNGQYYVCFTNDHQLEITNGTTSVEQVAPLRTFTTSNSFEISLSEYAQQISPIADQTLAPSGSSGPLSFNFGNLGTTAGSTLTVLATSSNQTVIPNTNLTLGGSGTNRTITVAAAAGQTGTSLITVSVTDGVSTNSLSFNVNVNNFALATTPTSQGVLIGSGTSYTANVSATNGFAGTVTFAVSGVPAGVSAIFNPPTIIGAGSSTLNIIASNSVAPGSYPLVITAVSGVLASTNVVTLVATNIVAAAGTMLWIGANNWSVPLNWTNITAGGNGPPGAANDVLFVDLGAVATTNTVNNKVDTGTTIKSLTYSNTNNFHTTQIAASQTLNISGASGLLVGTETDNGISQAVKVTISGQGGSVLALNGGNLTVRQGTANSGGTQRATLDLSSLETFTAPISRMIIGSEGVNPRPVGTVYLARTNLINASGAAPAIAIGGAGGGSGNSGSASQLYLGQANQIFAGSITVGRVKQSSSLIAFNPALTNAIPVLGPSAIFRSSDGVSAIPAWIMADSGTGGGTVNTGGAADFSGGAIDALVGTLTLGKSSTGSGAGNPTGTFTFNAGTVEANTLQVGYQASSSANGGANFATGTMNVNGGTLAVDAILQLALTTGGSGAASTVGVLNLNGGMVLANVITNGGGSANININSGTLDLQPAGAAAAGKIMNATTINVGAAGLSDTALLTNAASISTANALTVSSNGVLAGNTTITSPRLLLNGAISPGTNSIGVITNSGYITLGAGGRYFWDIQDGGGIPGTTSDFISSSGGLDIQATAANPFIVQVQAFAEVTPGDLPNFDNNLTYSWIIASGTGITNFLASEFRTDTGQFPDDLAGGYFFVGTNGNSLTMNFTNNHPPTASDASYYLTPGGVLQIPIAALAPHWSDPDGDPVQFAGVTGGSADATNNVSTDGTFIYYTNMNNGADTITYSVVDVRTNPPAVYRPGDTVRTGVGLVQILPPVSISGFVQAGSSLVWSGSNGVAGRPYYVLASTNVTLPLANWTRVTTNQFDQNGNFQFTNDLSGAPQQFYMLQLP